MFKLLILIYSLIIISSCTNQTIYSGKIIDPENLNNINFDNKEILINKFGLPTYIDPIDKKYFYFSKKIEKSNIFNKKINYSYIFVFNFDDNNKIVSSKVYDLTKTENVKLVKEETDNLIIQRGLIEKVFGGVGPQQELPTTP